MNPMLTVSKTISLIITLYFFKELINLIFYLDAYDLAAPAVTSPIVSEAECAKYDRERKVCLEAVEVKPSGATTTCAASTMLTVLTAGLMR